MTNRVTVLATVHRVVHHDFPVPLQLGVKLGELGRLAAGCARRSQEKR